MRYVETLRLMVHAWECDEFGHVNVRFYMGWVSDAALSLISSLGFDPATAAKQELGCAGVRAEVDFRRELNGGDVVCMETAIAEIGERKLVFQHRMRRLGDDAEVMTAKITVVCLHLVERRARPWPAALLERARALVAPQPEAA